MSKVSNLAAGTVVELTHDKKEIPLMKSEDEKNEKRIKECRKILLTSQSTLKSLFRYQMTLYKCIFNRRSEKMSRCLLLLMYL